MSKTTVAIAGALLVAGAVFFWLAGRQETAQPRPEPPAQSTPEKTPPFQEDKSAAADAPPAQEDKSATGDAPAAPGAKLSPLEIALPEAIATGTPKNISTDNLEAQTGKPRPPFLAPIGVKNAALNKKVTSSDSWPIIGDLRYVTDGDKEGLDGSFVELGPGVQYVQIDLERRHKIYAVVVWHYHSDTRVYHDVIVRVSDDKDFAKGVSTLFNNDHDNSSGLGAGTEKEYVETFEGKLINARGASARHVRLYSKGSTASELNHYIEVEVYGLPAVD